MNLFGKKDLNIFEELNNPDRDKGAVLKRKHFETAFGVRRQRNNPRLMFRNQTLFEEIDDPMTDETGGIINPLTHVRRIRNYLSRDRSILESTDEQGRTPLIAAINANDHAAVQLILNFHPDVNKIYTHPVLDNQMTPLMRAVMLCEYEISKMLINAGADISIRLNGLNVIDIVGILIQREQGITRKQKFMKIRDYILKANHSSRVIQGNFKKYITTKRTGAANVIKKNYLNYAYTPGGPGYNRVKKHFETAFGRKRMNLFGKKDLDIFEELNNPDRDKGAVLKQKHIRNLRNILSNDRSILEITDGRGRTPLMLAVNNFDKDALKLILSFNPPGINRLFYINFLNDHVTPLMVAVHSGYSLDYVKDFMKHGADIYTKSSKGKTVFDYAMKSVTPNSKKVLEYLEKVSSAANVIKKHWKSHREHEYYKPGGTGYYEAKKHFESAFGRKRKVRKLRKLPKALIRMAKKYKVKVSIKRGNKRIYKSINVIKRQIRQKKNKMKK